MTDINKLIDGIVRSMDEEDLEYLAFKVEARLAELSIIDFIHLEYEVLCSCGHNWCPACRGFDMKVEVIR